MIKQNILEFTSKSRVHTLQEKAQCVSWFIETKSDIQAQQNFICTYGKKSSAQPTIFYFATNLPLVDMSARTWQEIEYQLDIEHVTDVLKHLT